MDVRTIGLDIHGQRYSLGELLLAGGTGLLFVVAGLGALDWWFSWFTLDALGVQVSTEGAGFLGWFAVLCAFGASWAMLALRVFGERLPKLPFKRTVVPLALAGLAFVALLLRYTFGVNIETSGIAQWSRGLGVNIAFVAGLIVLAGAVIEFIRDADPFISE